MTSVQLIIRRRVRQRLLSTVIAAALVALASVPAAHAAQQFSVGARVVRYANAKILTALPTLRVEQSDVRRGYVNVDGVTLQLKSNTRNGFLLSFASTNPDIRDFSVSGFNEPVHIDESVGFVVVPGLGSGMRTLTKDLRFRIAVAPDVVPGVYEWPIRITATPK